MKMTQTELMDFLWETIRSKKNCNFELGRKAVSYTHLTLPTT